jgi:16S rRNA (uracil1498-N3)-methyltransferase
LTSRQFYAGKKLDPNSDAVILDGKEHHHLARVARFKKGDEVWLFDDEGLRVRAVVESIGKESSQLRIVDRNDEKENPVRCRIVLGQSVIRPGNMDLIVQKATELGVASIVPLLTSRSLAGREEREERKEERWRRIALEASKQSLRPSPPNVEPWRKLEAFLEMPRSGRKIFLSEKGGRLFGEILTGAGEAPEETVLLVGPEGGWTEEEISALERHGYESASLGRTIVRAETAAICAIGMIAHFWNN